jgi:hypothetical protein|tara:strand:- start:5228 stop:5614 length:387 start_codon:yes stop_codon:yes gene_type:complete
MSYIESFKGRGIDTDLPVKIYRCLNRKGVVFSVQQKGKVIGHTSDFTLFNAVFKISKSGQKRARESSVRNVHAFAVGSAIGSSIGEQKKRERVKYNPFLNDFFYIEGSEGIVEKVDRLHFSSEGLFVI